MDAPWPVLAQSTEPESALLAGAWDARTGRGNGYRGVTTSILKGHAWPRPGKAVAQIDLQVVQIQRTAGT